MFTKRFEVIKHEYFYRKILANYSVISFNTIILRKTEIAISIRNWRCAKICLKTCEVSTMFFNGFVYAVQPKPTTICIQATE